MELARDEQEMSEKREEFTKRELWLLIVGMYSIAAIVLARFVLALFK